MLQRILRNDPAAQYCGLSGSTFEKMRIRGEGPEFIKLGSRAVGYEVTALDRWLENRRRLSTSDQEGVA